MTQALRIDINCDMGEGFGAWSMGNDIELLDHVSSANIACGFHAGDPSTMRRVVAAALHRGVRVGAHPGLPDLQGFGRRVMQVSPAEVYAMVVYQVGALGAFAKAAGGALSHVKAHGALYNMAAKDRALADAIARAVHEVDPRLVLFGLAGSEMIRAAEALGLPVAAEVFADRSYQDDGSLSPRGQPGALIEDADVAAAQVLQMVSRVLDACPGWSVDISWDIVQERFIKPEPGMPTTDEWAQFVTRYQDRVLWGSDTVIYSRNVVDAKGVPTSMGKRMTFDQYMAVPKITSPLFEKVGPQISQKVRVGNYVKLFDGAKKKVRAWEAAHAADDVWDLSAR